MNGVAPYITEKEFLQTVRDMARVYGWLTYHTLRSKGSEAGFPDLILLRGAVIIFAELKTERGRLTTPQREWLQSLEGVRWGSPDNIQVYCWRPSDLDQIQRVLQVGLEVRHDRLSPGD